MNVEIRRDEVAILHDAPGCGIAEPSRLQLHDTGTPWCDATICTREDLLSIKANGCLPFGQVPGLEVDGLKLSESGAIIRYLVHTRDMVGDSLAEAAQADMLAERLLKLRSLLAFQPFAADPDAELRRVLDSDIPTRLPVIEAWLSPHADLMGGFAVGS